MIILFHLAGWYIPTPTHKTKLVRGRSSEVDSILPPIPQSKRNIQGTGLNSNHRQSSKINKDQSLSVKVLGINKWYFEILERGRHFKEGQKSWRALEEKLIIHNCTVFLNKIAEVRFVNSVLPRRSKWRQGWLQVQASLGYQLPENNQNIIHTNLEP